MRTPPPGRTSGLPSRAEIDQIVGPLVDCGWVPGLVVGFVSTGGRTLASYGSLETGRPSVPDGRSVFQIGSITKHFVLLLLLELAQRGHLDLAAPAARYLPQGFSLPRRGNREITIDDLIVHRSGLPREPDNLPLADPLDPHSDYTPGQLETYLASARLMYEPGDRQSYSNTGYAVLGRILEHVTGEDLESLLRARFFDPFGMPDTGIAWTPSTRSRAARGHRPWGEPVPTWRWTQPTFRATGALHSTTEDLLGFVEAMAGLRRTTFDSLWPDASGAPGIRPAQQPGGQDFGFSALIGYNRTARTGLVVLANAATFAVHQVGQALDSLQQGGASSPWKPPCVTTASDALLDECAGDYRFSPEFWSVLGGRDPGCTVHAIPRERRLWIEHSGAPPERLDYLGHGRFLERGALATYAFTRDGAGHIDGLEFAIDLLRLAGRAELVRPGI